IGVGQVPRTHGAQGRRVDVRAEDAGLRVGGADVAFVEFSSAGGAGDEREGRSGDKKLIHTYPLIEFTPEGRGRAATAYVGAGSTAASLHRNIRSAVWHLRT